MAKITANVGDHSKGKTVPNHYKDVVEIQKLLTGASKKLNNALYRASDPPDGKIHSDASKSKTVKAIYHFQKYHLKFNSADGIVEPGKQTFQGLMAFNTPVVLPSYSSWDWPLASNKIRRGLVNHTFGMVRKYADGKKKPHQGWDFFAIPGTACCAIANGVVHETKDYGDYGKQVVLKHNLNGKTIYSHYAHLKSWSVTKGNMFGWATRSPRPEIPATPKI